MFTELFTHANLRMWIIPLCMGIVWIGSFLVSFFYNYEGNSPTTNLILRLINAFNLILLFDILLMLWDIRLSLKDHDLHEDHSFKAQCRIVPFCILAAPLAIVSFYGGIYVWIYASTLFCAKVGMHHSIVFIEKNKIPIYYEEPLTIFEE